MNTKPINTNGLFIEKDMYLNGHSSFSFLRHLTTALYPSYLFIETCVKWRTPVSLSASDLYLPQSKLQNLSMAYKSCPLCPASTCSLLHPLNFLSDPVSCHSPCLTQLSYWRPWCSWTIPVMPSFRISALGLSFAQHAPHSHGLPDPLLHLLCSALKRCLLMSPFLGSLSKNCCSTAHTHINFLFTFPAFFLFRT